MKNVILFCFLIVFISSCSKYRDCANEAIQRQCSIDLIPVLAEQLKLCFVSNLSRDECYAYTSVTFCSRIK